MMEAAGDGPNHTHDNLILRTIYAAGLRVNELTQLLVADVGVASRNGKNRTLRVLEHSQWQESAFFDFDRLPGVVTS
jgi:site-specific recombinase XerD